MRRYTLETICLLALAAGAASAQESAAQKRASAEEVFQTIRSDDMSTLRQLVSGGAANVKDKLSMSALHYAALYGSSEAVRILRVLAGDNGA